LGVGVYIHDLSAAFVKKVDERAVSSLRERVWVPAFAGNTGE
jgi:hypothetical protein